VQLTGSRDNDETLLMLRNYVTDLSNFFTIRSDVVQKSVVRDFVQIGAL